MGFGLLAPVALAALAALLLPLLLHLARRDATRPTPFAALRWLRERPRPRRRLRFDDWPLLLVRLLLLALLALWLARPVLHGEVATARWTVVVPGVAEDAIPAVDDAMPVHWLAPGFPATRDTAAPEAREASVSSLLREVDMTLPPGTALTVIVPETVAGIDAGRLVLSRPVDWRVVRAADVTSTQAADVPPQLDVFGIADDDPSLRVLQAVTKAWRPDDADALRLATPDAAAREDAVIVWWGAGAPPVSLLEAATARVLLLGPASESGDASHRERPDGDGLFVRTPCGMATCVRVTRALDPASEPAVVDPAFAARLQHLLRPLPAPTRLHAADLQPTTGADAWPSTPRDLRPWWALVLALVFALERWMAASARRTRMS